MVTTRNTQSKRRLTSLTSALLAGLIVAGCGGGGPDSDDGVVINSIPLPTDTILNLTCRNVGIAGETCILDDEDNPFRLTATREFNVNDPDAPTKFELANGLPEGPTGAKSRFYLWATALARFPSGENQYYTALALHELWDAEGDPIIRDQALRAYRSVLDNFFGSVTFFIFFEGAPEISFPLNERVASHIVYPDQTTGFVTLVDGDVLVRRGVISEWGYSYDLCTDLPECNNGVVSVSTFP